MPIDTDKDTTYHLVGSTIEDGFELTTAGTTTDAESDAAHSNAIGNNNNNNSVIDNPIYLRVIVMALGIIIGGFTLFMAFFMTLMSPMLGDSGEFDFHLVGFVLLWIFWVWRLGIAVLVNAFQYASNQNGLLSKMLQRLGGLLCRGVLTLLLYVAIDWLLTHSRLDFLLLAAPFQLLARWYASVILTDLAIKRTVLCVTGRVPPTTTTTSTWMPFQQHCRRRPRSRDGILPGR